MGMWEDVLKRRMEKDPLISGGNHRPLGETSTYYKRCVSPTCQSGEIEFKHGIGTCFECGHVWRRKKTKCYIKG